MNLTDKQLMAFHKKVNKTEKEACWLWLGQLEQNGYARIRVGRFGNRELVHRVAYFLAHGQIDENLLCCHRCDNRSCVNPDHLFLGTYSDNNKDTYNKGRNPRRVLSPEQVKEIRSMLERKVSHRKIAVKFCVGKATITAINIGTNWKQNEIHT